MEFKNMRLENIRTIVYYKPDKLTGKAINRRDHILGINISGAADHDLGYKSINLKPDYIYFFNQNDDFTITTKEIGYCYSIHFTTDEPIETESFCKKVNNTEDIIKMIQKVETGWRQKEQEELLMLSHFYNLCSVFYRIYSAPYKPKDQRILSAKDYIDLNFKEKDCLQAAADICQITRRRFNDIFKSHFYMAPSNYVLSKKIEYAKELLICDYLSISDIAEMSGFSDVYYFSKVFKQETHTTPAQYRKANK